MTKSSIFSSTTINLLHGEYWLHLYSVYYTTVHKIIIDYHKTKGLSAALPSLLFRCIRYAVVRFSTDTLNQWLLIVVKFVWYPKSILSSRTDIKRRLVTSTSVMAETKKVEVVISGVAGVFPESDNVEELKDLLFSKQNGVTLDSRRWPLGEINITIDIYVIWVARLVLTVD